MAKWHREHISNWKKDQLFERSNGRCIYCGEPLDSSWQVEHIIPVCHGGKNGMENLGACCQRCNLMKGGLDLETFRYKLTHDAVRQKNLTMNKYLDGRLLLYLDDEQTKGIFERLVELDYFISKTIEVKFYFERL